MTQAIDSREETPARNGEASITRPLLALIGAWAALLAVSCLIAYFVVGPSGHGASQAFDLSTARLVARHRPSHLNGIAEVVPALGLAFLTAVVFALVVRYSRTNWRKTVRPLLAIAVSGAGAYGLSSALKEIFTRARPPMSLASIVDNGFSFPSSHSTVGLAMLVTLVLVTFGVAERRMRMVVVVVAVVLAVLMPASRLLLGVHWTTDVLIGSLVGATWGAIAHRLIARLPVAPQRQRSEQPSRVQTAATTSDGR